MCWLGLSDRTAANQLTGDRGAEVEGEVEDLAGSCLREYELAVDCMKHGPALDAAARGLGSRQDYCLVHGQRGAPSAAAYSRLGLLPLGMQE